MVLKRCKQVLAPIVTHICNLSLISGVFPDCLKVANVCPIFKSGDPNSITNYRPISLLSSLSKVIEKVVNQRLTRYLDKYNILSANQYGFRCNKSTEDAISDLVDHVTEKLDDIQKYIGVFIDLAKAFDTVSRPILFKKLEGLGIRGIALDWFVSYLTNSTQQVRLNEHEIQSSLSEITFGVPQGSVLGPTIFLVYINDLCSLKLQQTKILAFADDTAVIFSAKSWRKVVEVAQKGLSKIALWLQNNLLTLNSNKTHYVAFRISQRSQPPQPLTVKIHLCGNSQNIECNCKEIQEVSDIKYLGVIIDKQLN